jgi:serine/threonine protein kinase
MATAMNSNSAQRSNSSYKVNIDCQTKVKEGNPETRDWLELTEKFDHRSPDYAIFKGLLEKRHRIVAKIAFTGHNQEFEVAKQLEGLHLPTLLNYFCRFECLDDRGSLNYSKRYLCKKTGDRIHVIIMPYVDGGQIDSHKWNRGNFDELKLVMKHIVYTLLYAAQDMGFIHNDLHVGNVLLKKTQRKEISYGGLGSLKVEGYMPVIMDYDKAYFSKENNWIVYKDLNRLFSLFASELPIVLDTGVIQDSLSALLSRKIEPSVEVCKGLCKDVDRITIRFAKSELPPMPDWLRGVRV